MTEPGPIAYRSRDTTPATTRWILVAVLVTTALIDAGLALNHIAVDQSENASPVLWLFTGLFVLRVAGQILVALRPRAWLPPMRQWNFIPYAVLLPTQLALILLMVWIDRSFATGSGAFTVKTPQTGSYLLVFSALYALTMLVRYSLRMARHPDQRWFGGTIPIVFHLVLASYLYTLGLYHVSG